MHSLTIDLPETLLLASGQSREEFLREARFFLALKLFEVGRLVRQGGRAVPHEPRGAPLRRFARRRARRFDGRSRCRRGVS